MCVFIIPDTPPFVFVGFVWDAKWERIPKNSQKDKSWWKHLEELKGVVSEDGNFSLVPSGSPLGFWIKAQCPNRGKSI
jgi:hypothetical protein